MFAVFVGGIGGDDFTQDVCVEDVVPHGGENFVGGVRQSDGVGGFLPPTVDLADVVPVHLDHSELVGEFDRLADGGDGDAGAGLDMLLNHLGEVHPVHVIGADDDHVVGAFVLHRVEALIDGVRAALVPLFATSLLGRDGGDVVAQQGRHTPGPGDVAVEAV